MVVQRLKHLDDGKSFKPTNEDCREWFNLLNKEIFGNKLPEIELKVKRLKGEHANFCYWNKCDGMPRDEIAINFNTKFASEKLFVEILAHEMIHLFQYCYDEPLGHGPSFWAWRDNLNIKGLTLHKVA